MSVPLALPVGITATADPSGWSSVRCACDWSTIVKTVDVAGVADDHARRNAWCRIHRDLTPVGADPTLATV